MAAVDYGFDYEHPHHLGYDSEEEDLSMANWEELIGTVDIPLLVDMSHWVGCITRYDFIRYCPD